MHRRLFAFWLGVALVCAAIIYIRWERFHELWWWYGIGVLLGLRLSYYHVRKLIKR